MVGPHLRRLRPVPCPHRVATCATCGACNCGAWLGGARKHAAGRASSAFFSTISRAFHPKW